MKERSVDERGECKWRKWMSVSMSEEHECKEIFTIQKVKEESYE